MGFKLSAECEAHGCKRKHKINCPRRGAIGKRQKIEKEEKPSLEELEESVARLEAENEELKKKCESFENLLSQMSQSHAARQNHVMTVGSRIAGQLKYVMQLLSANLNPYSLMSRLEEWGSGPVRAQMSRATEVFSFLKGHTVVAPRMWQSRIRVQLGIVKREAWRLVYDDRAGCSKYVRYTAEPTVEIRLVPEPSPVNVRNRVLTVL